MAALEHWTGRCMDGQTTTPPPLVVIASWRPAGDALAQQAAVEAAERWCTASGSIPHCLVSGVADRDGARRAFEEALAEAQARRDDGAGGSSTASKLAPAEPGSAGAAPAWPRQLLRMNSSMNPLYRFRRSSECLPPVEEEAGGEAALGASTEP